MIWPPPVLKMYHNGVIAIATGASFWEAVGLNKLKEVSILPAERKQITLVAERVMSCTQAPLMDKVKTSLIELCTWLRAALPTCEVLDDVVEQMEFVNSITDPHKAPFDTLALALGALQCKDREIVFALKSFPKGRTLVEIATCVRDEKEKITKVLQRVAAAVLRIQVTIGKRSNGGMLFSEEASFYMTVNKMNGVHKLLGGKLTPTLAALQTTSLRPALVAMASLVDWGVRLWRQKVLAIATAKTPEAIPDDWKVVRAFGLLKLLDTVMGSCEDAQKICMKLNSYMKVYDLVREALCLQAQRASGQAISEKEGMALHSELLALPGDGAPPLFDDAGAQEKVLTFMRVDLLKVVKLDVFLKERSIAALSPRAQKLFDGVCAMLPAGASKFPLADKSFLKKVLAADPVFMATDTLLGLSTMARDFNDKQLADQASLLNLAQRLLSPVAKLAQEVLNSDSRDDRRLTDVLAQAASTARVQNRLWKNFVRKVPLANLFEVSENILHLPTLDKVCMLDGMAVAEQVDRVLDACSQAWAEDLSELTKAVESWIPLGWERHTADPDFLSKVDVLMSLVMNPEYTRLHAGSEMLTSMLSSLRIVSKDGLGPIVDANILLHSSGVQRLAADTVTHSYVVLLITQTIPACPSPAARKKQTATLKTELGKKFKSLGDPLQQRFKELENGDEVKPYDFQELNKIATEMD